MSKKTISPFCNHEIDVDKLVCKKCGKLVCDIIVEPNHNERG